MKISKLFHWLYALVMLLPIFAIGVTCAYAIFNKNAYQSYYGETINEEQSELMTNINQFETNQIYNFNSGTYDVKDIVVPQGAYNYYIEVQNVNIKATNIQDLPSQISVIALYIDSGKILNIRLNRSSTYTYVLSTNYLSFDFEYVTDNLRYNFAYNNIFSIVTYKSISFVSEVFYYSIDKVQQSSLFNWAYDSFLATPITYITGLFGIANDHISVMLMSYWLAISIIWLVFDLVMYMPLLVHRWLDKGVLE